MSADTTPRTEDIQAVGELAEMLDGVRLPVRLRCLFVLGSTSGNLNIGEVAERVGSPRTDVGKGLKLMKRAGVVKIDHAKCNRFGTHAQYYCLTPGGRALCDALASILSERRMS